MIPRLSRDKPWKTVREFHYSGTYRKDYARLQGGIRARVMAALSDFYEFGLRRGTYDATVVLTRQDREENWKGRRGVHVIPNPCVWRPERVAPLERPRAVAVGRLVPVKGFGLLVRAWEKWPPFIRTGNWKFGGTVRSAVLLNAWSGEKGWKKRAAARSHRGGAGKTASILHAGIPLPL